MKSIKARLQDVTHQDLREWAGSTIFNRAKGYMTRVSQLSRTDDGTLVAWVSGNEKYATSVKLDDKEGFDFNCTCPYHGWGPCKHAVAVLLATAEQLKKDKEIPLLDPDDDLYRKMFGDLQEEDWTDEDDDPDLDSAPGKPAKTRVPQIESILAGKRRDELLALLIDLAADFPEVARRIRDAAQLETGQIDKLVRSLRREIRNLTAEEAWSDHWKGGGNLPDYSHVGKQLRALLDKGHADAVLELGAELWDRGNEQVGQSHDEGETASAIADCLAIVLQALPGTTLSPPEQLLWLIDHEIDDDFSLLTGADAVLNNPCYSEDHWRETSIALEKRLQRMKLPKADNFSESYRRTRTMTWLRDAYRRSGQQQKVIPLLEQEADRCRSYETLVEALLETGERDRARQWCIRGFNKTIKDAPGIAGRLQERLRQLAEDEGKLELATAYRAEDFFDRPSEKAYIELRQAAEKVKSWPTVRDGVLHYLQTGKLPHGGNKGKKAWPLPKPEVQRPESREKFRLESFPNREMLIEIAILERRNDDAVTLYRTLAATRRWSWDIDERLAKAVTRSHPQIALQIWKSIADRLIGQVKPKAYQQAAVYLKCMHKIYEETGHLGEWKALTLNLRVEHKAKRRLMEVLDELENNRKLLD